jgi:hypothetical protein
LNSSQEEGAQSPSSLYYSAVFDRLTINVKGKTLLLCSILIVTIPVFAQNPPVPDKNTGSPQRENPTIIHGLTISDHYPSCHRMKNWAATSKLKITTTE